ncbi:MAG: DUF4236 domain-containing protein [Luteimonas sp.]
MAIRFRKSFKLAPGIRMNVSPSSLGASFGPRGASVSVGKQGVYGNVGIAGTGLSTRNKLSGGTSGSAPPSSTPTSHSQATEIPLSVGVDDEGTLTFKDQTGAHIAEHLVAAAKKQHGDAIKALIQRKCDEINGQIEAVGSLHNDTPSPSSRPKFVAQNYSEAEPTPPKLSTPGFFAKFFASQRAKVDAHNQEAMRLHDGIAAHWEAGLATHHATESKRRKRIEELIYSDPEAMEEHLEEALQVIEWPRETLIAAELQDGGKTVMIDVDLPEIEDMPNKKAGMPARGMKLSVKDMSPTEVKKLYMSHIHSIGFRIIGEAFAALPEAQQVVLSGYSQRPDKATGRLNGEYLYSVRVTRRAWLAVDFSAESLERLDVVEALGQFDLRRNMSKTGIFKPVAPFNADDTTK